LELKEANVDIIKAPTTINHSVYRAEFKHAQHTLPSNKNGKGIDDYAEIQRRLVGNIMEVGEPECWNLKALCNRKKIKIPEKVNMLLDKSDFWLIQSAFSFIPAHGSQFIWARIVTSLEALTGYSENHIAYDAYPKNIFQEINRDKEINIGLNFKFETMVEAKAEYIQKIESTRLEPVISVAGIGKKEPTWNFSGKAAFCLQGVSALYIILKTPVNSRGIKLSFFSHAEISTKWGGVIPTTAKPKGEESYELKF
jgi:hypothetical protein